jgi:flagellar basal body rod protein FlgG
MSGNLYVSAAGAEARLTQLDMLSNNLANADTTGFRAGEVVFEAALEAALLDAGDAPAAGRTFVGTTQSALRSGPGPIRSTGRELDVAVDGEGFFVVETPGGPRYTRAGSFRPDPIGFLVGGSGHPVLGEAGPIAVGSRPLRIEADGSVLDDLGERVGRLRIETFPDPSLLVREGGALLRAPEGVGGLAEESPRLVPRSLEGSNVLALQDLARLIIVQRAFDAAMKTIEAEDAASSRLLQEI